jgi:Clp amino terminal domain, pathogenicity island component
MTVPEIIRSLRTWLRHRRRMEFSAEVLELIENAKQRSRSYGHDYVGVEHVFLSAWVLPCEHAARRMIAAIPVDVPVFIVDLENQARVVTGRPVPDFIPHTPRLRQVLELSKFWARWSDGDEIQITHVLGAIATERNSLVSHVLRKHISASKRFDDASGAGVYFAILTSFPKVRVFDVRNGPNKSLEPTPTAVTPPAGAGGAPASGVAEH